MGRTIETPLRRYMRHLQSFFPELSRYLSSNPHFRRDDGYRFDPLFPSPSPPSATTSPLLSSNSGGDGETNTGARRRRICICTHTHSASSPCTSLHPIISTEPGFMHALLGAVQEATVWTLFVYPRLPSDSTATSGEGSQGPASQGRRKRRKIFRDPRSPENLSAVLSPSGPPMFDKLVANEMAAMGLEDPISLVDVKVGKVEFAYVCAVATVGYARAATHPRPFRPGWQGVSSSSDSSQGRGQSGGRALDLNESPLRPPPQYANTTSTRSEFPPIPHRPRGTTERLSQAHSSSQFLRESRNFTLRLPATPPNQTPPRAETPWLSSSSPASQEFHTASSYHEREQEQGQDQERRSYEATSSLPDLSSFDYHHHTIPNPIAFPSSTSASATASTSTSTQTHYGAVSIAATENTPTPTPNPAPPPSPPESNHDDEDPEPVRWNDPYDPALSNASSSYSPYVIPTSRFGGLAHPHSHPPSPSPDRPSSALITHPFVPTSHAAQAQAQAQAQPHNPSVSSVSSSLSSALVHPHSQNNSSSSSSSSNSRHDNNLQLPSRAAAAAAAVVASPTTYLHSLPPRRKMDPHDLVPPIISALTDPLRSPLHSELSRRSDWTLQGLLEGWAAAFENY
ncbi:hypothetical protein MKZ38_001187 [Zalerion maritima]|uniref:Uncharacterized protein n=1 Tax=Zalerion maritima TaxID=339359 RepID=A0AAD5RXX9_9PEZI|nr:hypothetical protein MKZ38_001187 [Zalerion maritima]